MFAWWRRLRRTRLARRPLPDGWLDILQRRVPFFADLQDPARQRFLSDLKAFVFDKHFEAVQGLELTDEIKVVIAAAAVRLTLQLDLSYYDRLSEIVVYPSHYRHPDRDGVIIGEAHPFGTVVLSWDAVLHGLRNTKDGQDTATHEFAHVLDRADGAFDGTPELHAAGHYRPWARVLSHHYLRLQKRGRDQRKVLRRYGATNEAEFFAVCTEAFFEKPEQMLQRTPDLYEELKRFYRWDPAAR